MAKVFMKIMPGGQFKITKVEGTASQSQCNSIAKHYEQFGNVDEASREERPQDVQPEAENQVDAQV